MSTRIHPDLRSEVAAIATEQGCEVFDLAYDGRVLKIVLDRSDGAVTLDDCSSVSRQVSAFLDVSDFGSARYTLEVSSPGLDRPLRDARDYRRFVGSLANVTYARPATDDHADDTPTTVSVIGRLEAFDDEGDPAGQGRVVLVEAERDIRHVIPLAQVRRARLEIEL